MEHRLFFKNFEHSGSASSLLSNIGINLSSGNDLLLALKRVVVRFNTHTEMQQRGNARKISLETSIDIACTTNINGTFHERTNVCDNTTDADSIWMQKMQDLMNTLDICSSLPELTLSISYTTLSPEVVSTRYPSRDPTTIF